MRSESGQNEGQDGGGGGGGVGVCVWHKGHSTGGKDRWARMRGALTAVSLRVDADGTLGRGHSDFDSWLAAEYSWSRP